MKNCHMATIRMDRGSDDKRSVLHTFLSIIEEVFIDMLRIGSFFGF